MLTELRVRDLGVIADLTLVLGPGMTALTGETGAGKTLVVEAIELLVGGRADRVLVRPGAEEAWVEGRFVTASGETVLARALPAEGGRSRAYVDGRMAPVGALAEVGSTLVDLHGQHAHQSLLAGAVQRAALDAFAGTDVGELDQARLQVKRINDALADLGGDARSRAREVDLLRFQIAEIEHAGLGDPDELDRLRDEEERLATAAETRAAAARAHETIEGEGGAAERVGEAIALVAAMPSLSGQSDRLRALQADLADVASELRATSETLDEDPERLASVRARRQELKDLCRKYGDTIAEIQAFLAESRGRLESLESHDLRVAELEEQRSTLERAVATVAARVAKARKSSAKKLALAIEERLRELALPNATIEIEVRGADPADEVTVLLAANPGEPALPLAKVASGGELARTMLAARLVLTAGPPTLVFDEVDAGIGGAAAVAVGRALAALGADHQVLVVTHLPQVAAYADAHVAVTKSTQAGRTVASAAVLEGERRAVEVSRMLSGQPTSATAREHAEELLTSAARERGR